MGIRRLPLYAVLTASLATSSCASIPNSCSQNWTVTGYYTPVESDFSDALEAISVIDHGQQSFPRNFLSTVKMEGWGKTRFGWYLGYYGSNWHRSAHPLDATGRPLGIGTVATDPNVITRGSTVVIANLEGPLSEHRLTALDVGSLVKQNHIDVYTGEGESAKRLTWRITGRRTVCIYPS